MGQMINRGKEIIRISPKQQKDFTTLLMTEELGIREAKRQM